MTLLLILGIIFLLLLIGIIFYVKQRVEDLSTTLFGTKSITKGLQDIQKEYEATPKSISAMTNIYLPNIMRDFPDFHYEEMRERAEHVLLAYLLSIHERKDQLPDYVNSDLKHQLSLHLQGLSNSNQRESFTSLKIHDCQLNRYSKEKGKCTIIFQASIRYYHTITNDQNKIIHGSADAYEQSKYNIHMIYIQDRSVVESAPEDALGLNCPNCGASITNLGQKFCDYCGSGIVALNINTWSFSDVVEL